MDIGRYREDVVFRIGEKQRPMWPVPIGGRFDDIDIPGLQCLICKIDIGRWHPESKQSRTKPPTLAEGLARCCLAVEVHCWSVCRVLRQMKLSHKKLYARELRRSDVKKERHVRIRKRRPFMKRAFERLVFIDETSANTRLSKRTGRASVGQRLINHVPFGHQRNRFGLFIRTIGIARTEAKLTLANPAYNFNRLIFDVLPGAISRRLRKDFPPMTTVYGWFPRLLPLRSSGKSPIRSAFRSRRGVGRSSAHPPGSTAIADWPGISRARLSPQHPFSMPLASWS